MDQSLGWSGWRVGNRVRTGLCMCECWSVGVGFLVIGATGKEWGFALRLWERASTLVSK